MEPQPVWQNVKYVYRTEHRNRICLENCGHSHRQVIHTGCCRVETVPKQHAIKKNKVCTPMWISGVHKYGFLIILLTRVYLHPQHVPRDVFLHVSFSLQQWPTFSPIVIKVSSHFSCINSSSSLLQTESGEFGIDIHVQTELCCGSKRILSDHAKKNIAVHHMGHSVKLSPNYASYQGSKWEKFRKREIITDEN